MPRACIKNMLNPTDNYRNGIIDILMLAHPEFIVYMTVHS